MPHKLKATNQQLLDAYAEHKSVYVVGPMFGMRPGSAHERLAKLGAIKRPDQWAEAEIERLKLEYVISADAGKLIELADDMGRLKTSIARKARELGLTDKRRAKIYLSTWKYVDEEHARALFEKFKHSSLGLGQYCRSVGYDDLGFSQCMKRHFADEWEHVIESKQISQTKYRYGRQFEYRVRDQLKAVGYFALRSPASRTPIDLVAIRPGRVLLIQCKRGGQLGVEEWNALYDIAVSCGAIPVLASCPVGVRNNTVYEHLVARKDGSRRAQPKREFKV